MLNLTPYGDWFAVGNKMLDLYSMRNQAIANDIANVNTPGYKITEVPFPDQLLSLLHEDDEQDAAERASRSMVTGRERRPAAMSEQERRFNLTNNLFDADISPLEAGAPAVDIPVNPNFAEEVAAVPFETRRNTYGSMRADGNNVSIDKAIVGYTHNSILYKGMAQEMANSAKEIKTILSGG